MNLKERVKLLKPSYYEISETIFIDRKSGYYFYFNLDNEYIWFPDKHSVMVFLIENLISIPKQSCEDFFKLKKQELLYEDDCYLPSWILDYNWEKTFLSASEKLLLKELRRYNFNLDPSDHERNL